MPTHGHRAAHTTAGRERLVRLGSRLHRLERSLPSPEPGLSAWESEAWDQLVRTLSSEHERLLEEEIDALCAFVEAPDGGRRPQTPLLDQVFRRVQEHDPRLSGPKGPPALPPVVAEVYLNEPEACFLSQRCRDCKYAVPAVWEQHPDGQAGAFPRWRVYFPRCPLCGGPTG